MDNSAADSGAVYVFTRAGTSWNESAYLKASNTNAGDTFGRALSDDGSVLSSRLPQRPAPRRASMVTRATMRSSMLGPSMCSHVILHGANVRT